MDRQDNMLHGAEPEELDTESTVQDNSGQVTQPAAENTDTPVEESTPESSPDEGSAGESAPEKMSDRDVMRHTASLWRYRTVAENGTELHTEYHCKHTRTGVGEIIGARVRGKKHKHEGTNCDDWFETAVAEGCFIAVVADGAGSKQLSRIGARVSCEAAVEYLRNEIPEMFSRDRGLRAKLAGDMSGRGLPRGVRRVRGAYPGKLRLRLSMR